MNLRVLALASALFLTGVVGVGSANNPILDLWGEASARIGDIEIVNPPNRREAVPETFFAREQVVEGHTTFATIDFQTREIEEQGNVTIEGFVHCDHNVAFETEPFFGIPIPTRITNAQAYCAVGERVFVTPDPFSGDPGSLGSSTAGVSLGPTGQVIPLRTPDGQVAYAEEFVFTTVEEGPDGEAVERTYYAWATPIFESYTNLDGKTKNFMLPIPVDRLRHNAVDDYRVVFENDS